MREYEAELIQSLRELISKKSVKYDGADDYEPIPDKPFGDGIADALDCALRLCASMGMKTKNCDGYVGYAEVGEGDEMLAVLMHLDVVPEGNGWDYPAFGGEIHNGKLYGRGAVDDKGPAVAVIYALKSLMDEGFEFKKRVRLIFGTDEECDWEDMDYYVSHEEHPTIGFTPDADFPLIYGEMGVLQAEMVMYLSGDNDLFMEGGEAVNAVPDFCRIWKESTEDLLVEEKGVAAHASLPWEGENAISKAMRKLSDTCFEIDPEVESFVDFYNEKIGDFLHGEGLGCDFEDEPTGKLTFNAGTIKADSHSIRLGVDIRCPVTVPKEKLIETLQDSISEYGLELENIDWLKPVYSSVDSEFVQTLLGVYREKTGDDTEPMTMGGGTYARAMDNIVAFGPLFPGREATEHMKNEYILVDDLFAIMDVYREAIKRLAE
ncbi:MAG: Sapep family Mn(2+)-dependent dipeptidase [Firmicutes bacterium]|nr:Sapep family Mn(2+)-dependent dipeptidase [Bacillota bacterium]